MSKKDVARIAEGLEPDDFQEVKLFNKWYQPTEGQSRIFFLPLARSQNVRSIWESKFPEQGDAPLFAWACELYCTTLARDRTLYEQREPCDAAIGSVFYLFENRALSRILQKAHAMSYVVRLQALRIENLKSGRRAWRYDVGIRPKSVETAIDTSLLMLPTPEHEGAIGALESVGQNAALLERE